MATNSLRDKVLQLIRTCDPNTTLDFPALLELRELLKSGSENDQENDYLPTIIHHAAKTESAELMRELARTRYLNFKTRSGLTALHVAAAGLHHDFFADHIDCRSATTPAAKALNKIFVIISFGCKSYRVQALCVADDMYGKGLDYLDSLLEHIAVDVPANINNVWLQDVIRACFQRQAKLTEESTDIQRLSIEYCKLQEEVDHSLSGHMRLNLVLPFTSELDRPEPSRGMILAVPYLTTCPALYYKKMNEILEGCAKSNITNLKLPEQMVMRLVQTYSNRQDVLNMQISLERYRGIVSLSQETKSSFSEQILYQLQGRAKGAIQDEDKLCAHVFRRKSIELDRFGTLITLSPDAEELSTIFDLGLELHHYSGVDSDLKPWISELQETAKIIPFIIALTARTSLGHTLEFQRGAAKHGLLDIYAMAVSNDLLEMRPKGGQGEWWFAQITIKEEMRLIRETKKIINELEIVQKILAEQLRLIIEASHEANLHRKVQGEAIKMSMVGVNSGRVDGLLKKAEEITKNVYNLLDLKQKGASLAEAQWTRKQAEETARQGNIIMGFTMVTIIFLPRDDKNELRLGLNWTLMYILFITAAIAVPLILVAFNINRVSYLRKLLSGNGNERQNKGLSPVGDRTDKGVKEVSQVKKSAGPNSSQRRQALEILQS
ncbi:hypothetical protein PspLS_06889 [Pyricularia sp. CBS 133598]|nr:hypothetical protein PspLS_06889 [Pyricularia sp. CBS 133598]